MNPPQPPGLSWTLDARMAFHGGIGTYVRHLAKAVVEQESVERLCLMGWPGESFVHPKIDHHSYAAPLYSLKEQLFPPPSTHATLLHSPHFNVPLRWKGRWVVTIHDLIPIQFPELTRSPLSGIYTRWMFKKIRQKAAAVIAVSQTTQQEFCEFTGIPKSQVTVIPHGVDPAITQPVAEKEASDIFNQHQVNQPFLLWVSAIRPHKNPELLLKAFLKLKAKGVPHQLVMIGEKAVWYDLKMAPEELNALGDSVRWISGLPYAQLAAFYQRAQLLAMPSRAEGFGLPVLEAMANGLPVVVSQTPALSELVGNAGVTVDPDDVDAWSDNLYNVLFNDDRRRNLSELGRRRAAGYTWQQSAAAHIKIMRAILASDRHCS